MAGGGGELPLGGISAPTGTPSFPLHARKDLRLPAKSSAIYRIEPLPFLPQKPAHSARVTYLAAAADFRMEEQKLSIPTRRTQAEISKKKSIKPENPMVPLSHIRYLQGNRERDCPIGPRNPIGRGFPLLPPVPLPVSPLTALHHQPSSYRRPKAQPRS